MIELGAGKDGTAATASGCKPDGLTAFVGSSPTPSTTPRIAVVIPTVRPERIAAWWEAWRDQLAGCDVYIIQDAPVATITGASMGERVRVESWAGIDADLGHDSWIIPRRTDCIRSYGFLLAYRAGADIIMTMDDDCLPPEFSAKGSSSWVAQHERALIPHHEVAWDTTVEAVTTRGVPYHATRRDRPTMLSHGLWNGVLDLDAPTQLTTGRYVFEGKFVQCYPRVLKDQVMLPGRYFPMCGMNIAFRREIAPAMYFLLMGQPQIPNPATWGGTALPHVDGMDWESEFPFHRFGDIWCGILAKRICDHLGYAVRSGSPHVLHERASDPFVNLRKEAAGIGENEHFWRRVDTIRLKGETAAECYLEIAAAVGEWGGEYADYWRTLSEAMRVWVRLLGQ